MPDPRFPGPPPGGPPPAAAPMPPPQGGPPGMPPGAPAAPPGPPPGTPDPANEQDLAQAELLSRLEQLGDQDLHTIQHGISPEAVAVLKKVVPELGVVLDLIEEGAKAASEEMGDEDDYEGGEGDEPDEGSAADEADDESAGEPEEPDEAEAMPPPMRSRTKLGRM